MSDNVIYLTRDPRYVPIADIEKCVGDFLDLIKNDVFINAIKHMPPGRYSAGINVQGKTFEIVISVLEENK